MVRPAEEDFGGVDIAVANAGIGAMQNAWEIDDEHCNDIIGVHLTGVFNTLRAASAAMVRTQRAGSIIAPAQSVPSERRSTRCVHRTKTGVIGLVRSFALELAQFGIS